MSREENLNRLHEEMRDLLENGESLEKNDRCLVDLSVPGGVAGP